MILFLYKDAKGEWRWTLKAKNSRKIGASTEGYKRRTDMLINLHDVTRIRVPKHWARMKFGQQLRLYVAASVETELQRVASSARDWS